MVRVIDVGIPCDSSQYSTTMGSQASYTFIGDKNPSLYTGTLDTFCIYINNSNGGGSAVFVTFTPSIVGGKLVFTANDISNTLTIPSSTTNTILSLSGETVTVAAGDYLGVRITDTNSNIELKSTSATGYYRYFDEHQLDAGNYPDDYVRNANVQIIMHASGLEPTPGNAPDACQSWPQMTQGDTYSGWGQIYYYDTDCTTSPYQTACNIITPWGSTENAVVFQQGVTRTWNKSGANPAEHWSATATLVSCLGGGRMNITECWWRESNTYYVKTSGSDSNYGTNWNQSFKTITKAASVVPDGGSVYIGFGTYGGETQIVPTSIGTTGIKYFPCTADSFGGTGSVTVTT